MIAPADTAIGRQRQPGRRIPRQPRPPGATPASPGSRASLTIMVKDSLAQIAQIAPTETALGRPTATARRLVDASVSANTRSAYAGALGQLDAWLDGETNDVRRFAYHGDHPFSRGSRILSPQACAVAASACLEKSPPEPTPLYSPLDYHPHGPRRPEQPHI